MAIVTKGYVGVVIIMPLPYAYLLSHSTPLQPQNLEPGMLFFAALGLDVDCCAALPFISLARRVDSTCFTNTLGLDWTGLIKTLTPWTSVRSPWPGELAPLISVLYEADISLPSRLDLASFLYHGLIISLLP